MAVSEIIIKAADKSDSCQKEFYIMVLLPVSFILIKILSHFLLNEFTLIRNTN